MLSLHCLPSVAGGLLCLREASGAYANRVLCLRVAASAKQGAKALAVAQASATACEARPKVQHAKQGRSTINQTPLHNKTCLSGTI
jgi:hypothetical protein